MVMRRFLDRIFSCLRIFAAQRAGVAAVEFAVVLPAALILYIGAYEVSDAVMTSRRLSDVTRTSVDLLSQQATSSNATSAQAGADAMSGDSLSSLFKGVALLMGNKPTTPLSVTLTAVDVKNNVAGVCCSVTVRWSATRGGTLRPCNVQLARTANGVNDPGAVPADLLPQQGVPLVQPIYYLISDTKYEYQPILNSVFARIAPPMQRTEYMRPRSMGQVVVAGVPTGDGQSGKICY